MPEMHLKQQGFTYSACEPFTKNRERIQKCKETGDTDYIYQNELDKTCFQLDMAYGDFKKLTRRTASSKVWRENAFDIATNLNYDGYKRGLASMAACSGVNTHANNESRLDLAEELHKPIIRKFEKRTVYSEFKDNFWATDLADMHLMCKFSKGFRFLLCVIDIFSKYTLVVPLKDKNDIAITNAFQKTLKESNRKLNKISVDKGSGLYNNFFKK